MLRATTSVGATDNSSYWTWGNTMPNWYATLKQAMATVSNFPDLNEAVAEFRRAHPEIEDLKDPSNAWGRCQEISEQLAAFLTQKGYRAYSSCDEAKVFDGYNDHKKTEKFVEDSFTYPEHCVVAVYGLPGMPSWQQVTIDFTAAQYGYTEFPKIHPGPETQTPKEKFFPPLKGNRQQKVVQKNHQSDGNR